jgi:hypothetical protein
MKDNLEFLEVGDLVMVRSDYRLDLATREDFLNGEGRIGIVIEIWQTSALKASSAAAWSGPTVFLFAQKKLCNFYYRETKKLA